MTAYTTAFYKSNMQDSIASAREIIPIVFKIIQPLSVIDFGCGIGSWLSVCKENGVKEIIGLDGDYIDQSLLIINKCEFRKCDLNNEIALDKCYDMVISLEVAEHIEQANSKAFVKNLIRHGDNILFSAAIPKQGGVNHVNEQKQSYWARLFAAYDYVAVDCIRSKIWSNDLVCYWYKQNIILYVRHDCLLKNMLPYVKQPDEMLDVIHPDFFDTPSRALYLHVLKSVNNILVQHQNA